MSEYTPQPEKKRKIPWTALSLVFSAATTYTVLSGTIDAHAQNLLGLQTAQERFIGDAASSVYGDDILVNCSKKTAPFFVPEDRRAYAITPILPVLDVPLGVIVLNPWICDSLSDFVSNPISNEGLPEHAMALHALSHELSHPLGKDGHTVEWREDVADCYGTQRVGEVAEAFGASPTVATDIARYGASIQGSFFQGYNTADGCFEGGKYDLDPNSPGVFPPPRVEN
jgi:hypothetical protein